VRNLHGFENEPLPQSHHFCDLYCTSVLQQFQPIALGRKAEPFSHPDWIFEIKWDGFRALAYVHEGKCRLISRNGNEFKSFPDLSLGILSELGTRSAILDGEIVCLDKTGRTQFKDLLFRRGEPRFCAFDVLWTEGEDLRYKPLVERKWKLRSLLPANNNCALYSDHIDTHGEDLFQLACENDLEGIVAKQKFAPYSTEQQTWFKIRNRAYTQWVGREELFERERETDPDARLWGFCTMACAP